MDTHPRADRAKAILADEVFKEAFDMVLSSQTDVFLNPNSGEDEIMEAARAVRSLSLIKGQLQSFVDESRLLKRKQQRGSAS